LFGNCQAAASAALGKAPEDLVMSTAEEYRERSELYQLLLKATPANEK
jgi:MYCBP-associated protein family